MEPVIGVAFDANNISSERQKVKGDAKVFKSQQEAVEFAAQNHGDELVVEFENDKGETYFAVVEVKHKVLKKSDYEPNDFHFDPKARVKGAIVVDEEKINVQYDGSVKRRSFNHVKAVDVGEVELDRKVKSALSLAMLDTGKVEGFKYGGSNTDWVQMVTGNRRVVLGAVDGAIGLVEAREKDLSGQLDTVEGKLKAAQDERPPDPKKISLLEKERNGLMAQKEKLAAQKEELQTYRAIVRAELLTDAKGDVIPGMKDERGKPVSQGQWRIEPEKAIMFLADRKAALEAERAKVAADPAMPQDKKKARLDSLDRQIKDLGSAIEDIRKRGLETLAAARMIKAREGALAKIGGTLAEKYGELKGYQDALQKAESEYATCNDPARKKVLEANIKTLKGKIEECRQELITVIKTEKEVFWKNCDQRNPVCKAAYELLNEDLKLLEKPNMNPLEVIESHQKRLKDIKVIDGGSKKWDGLSPNEGVELLNIDKGVKAFTSLYASVSNQVKLFEEKVAFLKSLPGFSYVPVIDKALDLRGAVKAGPPHGTEAAKANIALYQKLGGDLQRLFPHLKTVTWPYFAVSACGAVAKEISAMESCLGALKTWSQVVGGSGYDAAKSVVKMLMDDHQRDQMFTLMESIDPQKMAEIRKAWDRGDHMEAASMFLDLIGPAIDRVQRARDTFVKINTEIAHNVGETLDTFMRAIAQGKDPMKVLPFTRKDPPEPGKISDPQGYLQQACQNLYEAYQISQQIEYEKSKTPQDAAKIAALEKRGNRLVLEATKLIGAQEQKCIMQQILDKDPGVKDTIKAATKYGYFSTSATTKEKLLPGGGDWAQFEDTPTMKGRMGVVRIDESRYKALVAWKADFDAHEKWEIGGKVGPEPAKPSGEPPFFAKETVGGTTVYYEAKPGAGDILDVFDRHARTQSLTSYTPKVPTPYKHVESDGVLGTGREVILTVVSPVNLLIN